MHVTPTELRVVRRGSLILRFAEFGPIAAVLAELPASGSLDTSLEEPCTDPHWGVVLRGELEVEEDGQRRRIRSGSGFHVPGGGEGHRFFSVARAVVAGFVPLDGRDAASVLETIVVPPDRRPDASEEDPAGDAPHEEMAAGEIRATTTAMGPWVMTRSVFGPTSGYGANFCDAPHWGVVVAGAAGIEYEDDVEVLGTGDFYHMAQGPPGHRIEVADGAILVDLTPAAALDGSLRLVEWRETMALPYRRASRPG